MGSKTSQSTSSILAGTCDFLYLGIVKWVVESAGMWNAILKSAFVLIWVDQDSDEISLVRLGSHSESFGQSLEYIRRIDLGRGMVKDGSSS